MAQNTYTNGNGGHAWDRVEERLGEAGFNAQTRNMIFVNTDRVAALSEVGSEAIRILTLPKQVGEAWGDRSNGNQVWAIVRNRRLVTVMLRRDTQPATPEAFGVEKVTIIG